MRVRAGPLFLWPGAPRDPSVVRQTFAISIYSFHMHACALSTLTLETLHPDPNLNMPVHSHLFCNLIHFFPAPLPLPLPLPLPPPLSLPPPHPPCHVSHAFPKLESLKAGDWVKIDLGVHIDGYMAVAAHTVIVGWAPSTTAPVQDDVADVFAAAWTAAEVAARMIKAGNTNAVVTAAVKKVADAFGVKAITGTLMHQVRVGLGLRLGAGVRVMSWG